MKKILLLFLFQASVCLGQKAQIIRGPYLQSVTPTSVLVRWRTDIPAPSQVYYLSKGKVLSAIDSNRVKDHVLKLHQLKPATRYAYQIDSKSFEKNRYVVTAPAFGSKESVRIWALGDFGDGSASQKSVMNSINAYTQGNRPDVWIWLGDNAYDNGKDEEYQKNVFDVYQDLFLQNLPIYPSPGNHDYAGKHNPSEPPYFKIFNMPTEGQAGGIISHSESYYSVNYGPVHLVALDTEMQEASGLMLKDGKGNQVDWLKADLAANKLPWVVVYFHKPPYSKGSHDSDTELDMKSMRENMTSIFEEYKVDLVIAGHSHVYERSFPMRGHAGVNETFDASKHIVAQSKAPNQFVVGPNGQGVIYVVSGSGGKVGGQRPGYPMKSSVYTNNTIGGSVLLDVSNHIFNLKWIQSDGHVGDEFVIEKP
jgi:UDP-2,3-diacylglucosamine pyrophosphatase LpxH